jgi:hypothetical protein
MLKMTTSRGIRGRDQKNQNIGRKKVSPKPPGYATQPLRERSISASAEAGQDDRWLRDMAILRQAARDRIRKRMAAKAPLPWVGTDDSMDPFAEPLEYLSPEREGAMVRSFYEHNPDQAASLLNVALRESSPGQRRRIGAALVSSGLVRDAIINLTSEKNKDTYRAFSLLFLVVKAGEIDPLVQVIETHTNLELRLKLIGLLVSSGERASVDAFRRLAVSKSQPPELRSTIVEALHQLNGEGRKCAPSAA